MNGSSSLPTSPLVHNPLDRRTSAGATPDSAVGQYVIGDAETTGRVDIPVAYRLMHARAAGSGALTVDFAELCGIPVSAADFFELAAEFRRWTVCRVPAMDTVPPDWVMRFVNLVDVLHDADLELSVYAEVPLPELGAELARVPDLYRTLSRLGELRAAEAAITG
ncbi:AFG1/ZapE family ATPase [Nocardia sp. NPDC020380]|uniref:AFG1/ZapE family ATPase n=1 Tax=Nocardia sp. NPDC020380 TaxID=3364309 RepID=UPI00379CA434